MCGTANPELCVDRCTLDGQRASPCQFECDPETGLCSDRCDEYAVETAVALDVFDPFCANRKALMARDDYVRDGFNSDLRVPPSVRQGLSTVPFSMFRNGLLHTGRSAHPGPEGVNVTWTYKTGGRVFSSPTLASDGTVYVGCTDGFVYGVQRSGVIKWKYPAGGPVVSTAAIGNPIGSDTTLFMGGSDGTLHAVSANYGTSKWAYVRQVLHLSGRWQMRARRPIVSSAAIAPSGVVYIGADSSLYALNAASGAGGFSGTVKWAYETRGLILGSPALDAQGRIFIGTMEGAVYCLTQTDGSFVWRFDAEGGVYSSPALDGEGTLYVGSVDGYLYALSAATGALAWKFRTNAAVYSSPAIAPSDVGLVFVGSTDWRLYAVRTRDGLLAWNQTLRSAPPAANATNATNSSASDVAGVNATGDAASAGDEARTHARVYPYEGVRERARRDAAEVLEAEGVCPPNLAQGTSEELAFRFGWNAVLTCSGDTPAVGVVASPVYSPNGVIYVGSGDRYFYAVDAKTGAVKWSLYTDGPIASSAAIDESGQLYFATEAGTIYQMDAPYVRPSDVFGGDPNDPFSLGR